MANIISLFMAKFMANGQYYLTFHGKVMANGKYYLTFHGKVMANGKLSQTMIHSNIAVIKQGGYNKL